MTISYKLHYRRTKQGSSLTLTDYTMTLSYTIVEPNKVSLLLYSSFDNISSVKHLRTDARVVLSSTAEDGEIKGHELSPSGRIHMSAEYGVACLTLREITADDSGKYVVSVENPLGADCLFASVAVEGPPEPPAGHPSVSSCGQGSVIVAWSSPPYDGGCMVTGYSVEMRSSGEQEWKEVADKCHSLSHTVQGLTLGESYVFRIRAENIHGASREGQESEPFIFSEQVEESFTPTFPPRVVVLEPEEHFKGQYDILEELGKGRYGVVHKVRERRTGQRFAAKFVRCIKSKDREKVQEEVEIMNLLRHPKLLQLAAAFDGPREIVMIMEYISGGELFERVVADDFTLTEKDCILFMSQICEGVEYMHENYVVHLDLKPENIMCYTRTSHQIKLIDFGLAQKLDPSTPVRVLFGTPEFIPPEIINYEPIGVESDMWSVGVVCYVLLSGLSPFMGDNDAETFANITRADYDFDDEAFDAISQEAKDFIRALLIKGKEERLTASECLQHAWLAQHHDNMSCVKLSTDKLKKFIIRRKWQKTGNAIRALGRMATLSAASRRNSTANGSFASSSPRQSISSSSLSASRMSSLGEEDDPNPHALTNECCVECPLNKHASNNGDTGVLNKTGRMRLCSERSDSGISDCSSIATSSSAQTLHHQCCQCSNKHFLGKNFSISEEIELSGDKLSAVNVSSVNTTERSVRQKEPSVRRSSPRFPSPNRTHTNSGVISCGGKESTATCTNLCMNNNNVYPFSPAVERCPKAEGLSPLGLSAEDLGGQSKFGKEAVLSQVNTAKIKQELSQQNLGIAPKLKSVPKDLPLTGVGKVLETANVLLSPTRSKSPPRKSSIPTSNEHSANYQKAMAFWNR
uniref:Myosin light chain kinase n=1 Tax=Timema douglasi TaxID=61478 RepID=A0A7R8VMB9_TIMDO|nr:unnamed protein product [Timema douglasi]